MSEVAPSLDGYTRETVLEMIRGDSPRVHIADHFPVYSAPFAIARFMLRYELFKLIADVHGSIIECGVKNGAGMFSWFQLSRLIEPHYFGRMIYGFDTFTGFPSVHEKDGGNHKVGDQTTNMLVDIDRWAAIQQGDHFVAKHDDTSVFNPVGFKQFYPPRLTVIRGDFLQTGDSFVEYQPSLICALLYLDFDLYEPTRKAIELFVPRMPKGAVIAFDELDHPGWPGETLAVLETMGVNRLRLRRFPWSWSTSYAVLE